MRSILAAAASMALMSVSSATTGSGSSAIVLPSEPRLPKAPRTGKKREPSKTIHGRDIGRSSDPYFGIKSNGRNGARSRHAAMEAGRPRRAAAPLSNPFKSEKRRKAFEEALKTLTPIIRNSDARRRQAMRVARRIAA